MSPAARPAIRRRIIAAAIAAAAVIPGTVAASSTVSPSATITVTTFVDSVAVDAFTSLREAITLAEAAGIDTITLSAATYYLSLGCGGNDDTNAGGDLDITDASHLTITGPSPTVRATITLDSGCTDERLIDVRGLGGLTVQNVDLVGGQAPDATAEQNGEHGGAIRSNTASITLTNVDLEGNSAGDAGSAGSNNTTGGNGGAVYTTGSLTMSNVSAANNHAGDGYAESINSGESSGGNGGVVAVLDGLGATVTITDSSFTNNRAGNGTDSSGTWGAGGGSGGVGWFVAATVGIDNSTFVDNLAGHAGDAAGDNGRPGGEGGALRIDSNDVSITGSTLSGNRAGDGADALSNVGVGGGGGAIALSANSGGPAAAAIIDCTVNYNTAGDAGNALSTSGVVSGAYGGRGGAVKIIGEVGLTVESSTFSFNSAGDGSEAIGVGGTIFGGGGGDGGAIFSWGSSVTVRSSSFLYNFAGDGGMGTSGSAGGGGGGGAIASDNYGLSRSSLAVESSTFTGNVVGSRTTPAGTGSGYGGAILFDSNSTKTFSVHASLFSLNGAANGSVAEGRGGAIYLTGTVPSTISSSTFYGNYAAEDGGALFVSGGTPLEIFFSTITENTAPTGGSSAIALSSGTVAVGGTVISGGGSGTGPACNLALTSLGYNAELTTSTCTDLDLVSDQLAVPSSSLGSLADNGGTAGNTRLPAAGGELRDAVPPGMTLCAEAPADQRGVARPAGDGCDIGAAEAVTSVAASDDYFEVEYGIEESLDVLGNDTGTTDDAGFAGATDLFVADVNSPDGGSATTDGSTVSLTVSSPLGQSFTYTVCHAVERSVCDTGTVTIGVTTPLMNPLGPLRLVDTRPGFEQGAITVTKRFVGGAIELDLAVAGTGGVPDGGVLAVALNVVATQATRSGFVTVYPCGVRPVSSSLNFIAGRTIANNVIAPLSADGNLCVYASADVHVAIDISGWIPIEAGFGPVGPTRLVDTRPERGQGAITVTKQLVGGATELELTIPGVAGVPDEPISAVVLNLTATQATGAGAITLYPCGTFPPVSSLNYVPGITVANGVIAPLSPSGTLCVYAKVPTHVIIDISGWFAPGAGLSTYGPSRIVDTRPTQPQREIPVAKTKIGGATELRLDFTELLGGMPAQSVVLNLTATEASGAGYVTIYPCGVRPTASSINFVAGVNSANGVIALLSDTNEICVFASSSVHVVLDMSAMFGPVTVT